jgi:hypothetical protein
MTKTIEAKLEMKFILNVSDDVTLQNINDIFHDISINISKVIHAKSNGKIHFIEEGIHHENPFILDEKAFEDSQKRLKDNLTE